MFFVQYSKMLSCKVVTLFPYRTDVPFNSLDTFPVQNRCAV